MQFWVFFVCEVGEIQVDNAIRPAHKHTTRTQAHDQNTSTRPFGSLVVVNEVNQQPSKTTASSWHCDRSEQFLYFLSAQQTIQSNAASARMFRV